MGWLNNIYSVDGEKYLQIRVIGQKELVTSPSNSEIQMTCVALPIPQHLPMWG